MWGCINLFWSAHSGLEILTPSIKGAAYSDLPPVPGTQAKRGQCAGGEAETHGRECGLTSADQWREFF